MIRRGIGLLIALALSLLVAPLGTNAQPRAKVARLGWLGTKATGEALHLRDVLQQALHTLGWVEGHNLIMEYGPKPTLLSPAAK
jgi:hypothetical protein